MRSPPVHSLFRFHTLKNPRGLGDIARRAGLVAERIECSPESSPVLPLSLLQVYPVPATLIFSHMATSSVDDGKESSGISCLKSL